MDSLFTSTTVLLTSEYVQLFTPEKLASKLCKVRSVTGVQFSKAKTTYALVGTWEQVNAAFKLLQHWHDQPEDEPSDEDYILEQREKLDENNSAQSHFYKPENGLRLPTITCDYGDVLNGHTDALNVDILKQAMIEGGLHEYQSIEDAVENLEKEVQNITQKHEARKRQKENKNKKDKSEKNEISGEVAKDEKLKDDTKEKNQLRSKIKNTKVCHKNGKTDEEHKKNCPINGQLKNNKVHDLQKKNNIKKKATVDCEMEIDNDFDIQHNSSDAEDTQNQKINTSEKKQQDNNTSCKIRKNMPKQRLIKNEKIVASTDIVNTTSTDNKLIEQIDKENIDTKSINIKIKIDKKKKTSEGKIVRSLQDVKTRKKITRKPGDTGYWSRIKINDYNEKHKCPKCDAVLKSRKRYMEHMRRIHIKEFQCKVCERRFGYPTDLHRHKCVGVPDPNNEQKGKGGRPKREKSDKPLFLPCPDCDYIGTSKKRLNGHVRRTHRLCFECDQCDKKFGFERDLHRHKDNVHCDPSHFCDKCSRFYKSKAVFEVHLKTHEDGYVKPKYECQFCSKSFTTKYVLSAHIKTEHLGIKKTYLCQICGKKFSQRNSYKQHSNAHNGIKPYVCDLCGKAFTYHKSLKEHKFMHDNVRRFQCTLCEKAFRQRTTLQIHLKVHKTVKDHICVTCGKGFSQKQALERHERIHTGIKPYTCVPCQRTFGDASTIRRHMLAIHQKNETDWRDDIICNVKKKTDYYVTGGTGQNRTYKSKSKVVSEIISEVSAKHETLPEDINPNIDTSALNVLHNSEAVTSDVYKSEYEYMSDLSSATAQQQQQQSEQLQNFHNGAIYSISSSQQHDQVLNSANTLPVNFSATGPVKYGTPQVLDIPNLPQVQNQKDIAVDEGSAQQQQSQHPIDVQQLNNVFQAATLLPLVTAPDGQRVTQLNMGQQVSGDAVLSQAMASIWGFVGYPAYYNPANIAQFQAPQNQ